jgi:hypothetical protein
MLALATAQARGIAHKGGTVHEDARLAGRNGGGHLGAGQGGRQGHIAAGQGLANRHDVGSYASVFAGKEAAATAKTGGNLVRDEQHTLLVAQLAHPPQIVGGIESHATGALDDGLQDNRR